MTARHQGSNTNGADSHVNVKHCKQLFCPRSSLPKSKSEGNRLDIVVVDIAASLCPRGSKQRTTSLTRQAPALAPGRTNGHQRTIADARRTYNKRAQWGRSVTRVPQKQHKYLKWNACRFILAEGSKRQERMYMYGVSLLASSRYSQPYPTARMPVRQRKGFLTTKLSGPHDSGSQYIGFRSQRQSFRS